MIKIDSKKLTERENYKLLSSTVIPRPIAFITSINDDKSINAAPFSFFNVVSTNPPLISVSILRKNGKMKDTARNILKNKEFGLHLTTNSNIEKINITSLELNINESELDLAKLTLVDSTKIKTPLINDALIKFEVKLVKHLTFKDDSNNITVDNIIGEILVYHLDSKIYKNTYINYEKLDPIGRLAGNNFITKDGFKEVVRPKTKNDVKS